MDVLSALPQVARVVYHLHSSFRPCVATLLRPPFRLERRGCAASREGELLHSLTFTFTAPTVAGSRYLRTA